MFRKKLGRFLLFATLAAATVDSRGIQAQEIIADQSSLVSKRMLDSLPQALQDERRATVEKALRDFPGSAEVFLQALLTTEFLVELRAAPRRRFGPVDPGPGLNVLPGRVAGIAGSGSEPLQAVRSGITYEVHNTIFVSPLLLDLNGDGLAGASAGHWEPHLGIVQAIEAMVAFDINGDGFEELTEWVDGSDGLLVEPEDPRRVLAGPAGLTWTGPVSGRDLVGTSEGYANGFRKLARRDDDGDGVIAGGELDGLYIWIDDDFDARIGNGELSGLAALDITALRLPAAGQQVGSFLRAGSMDSLWDWWPSYALARKLPAGPILAGKEPLLLQPNPVPGSGAALVSNVHINTNYNNAFWHSFIARADLEAAGLDEWIALGIMAVAPDGSLHVLLDRNPSDAEVAAGTADVLWTLQARDNNALLTKIPVAVSSVHQVVFDTLDSMLVIGQNGARILRVDLATGEQHVLMEPVRGAAGFHAGDYAWRNGGSVYLTGYFYNAEHEAGPNCIVRFSPAGGGFRLEPVANLDQIRSHVRQVGTILMEHLVSPELAFFMIEGAAGTSRLAVYQGLLRDPLVFAGTAYLSGMAASGSRVLYFKPGPGLSSLVEAIVHDVATGEEFSLGQGAYCYPYLMDEGRKAVLTTIDWSAGSSYFQGLVYTEGSFSATEAPALATGGIGTLRVAEDGSVMTYLGPEGIHVGSFAPPPQEQFLRGDCNGDGEVRGTVTDAVFLLTFNYLGGPRPGCLAACDANGDGEVVGLVTDAVYILTFNFLGGPRPMSPFPACGPGELPDDEALGCEEPPEACP